MTYEVNERRNQPDVLETLGVVPFPFSLSKTIWICMRPAQRRMGPTRGMSHSEVGFVPTIFLSSFDRFVYVRDERNLWKVLRPTEMLTEPEVWAHFDVTQDIVALFGGFVQQRADTTEKSNGSHWISCVNPTTGVTPFTFLSPR